MTMINDATFEFGGTDYSSQVRSINGFPYSVEELDDTAMGDNTRSTDAGLFNWSFSVECFASETSGQVPRDLFSSLGNTGTLTVARDSSAVSATNPDYTGTARLMSIDPLVGGAVGDNQMVTLEFAAAGDLSRSTS